MIFLNKNEVKRSIINEESKIKDVVNNLEKTRAQIALVINKKKKLIGTITDGDIRRNVVYVSCSELDISNNFVVGDTKSRL